MLTTLSDHSLLKEKHTMMTIKILGSGCANCKKLEAVARAAAEAAGIQAEFIKVTNQAEILDYDILSTPALVINEKVVCAGKIPTQADVTQWLTAA
jgi:small redox-active disulfide protein 2